MSSIGEVKRITDDSPKFREVLFARGYLFTDAEIDGNAFPFYGEWRTEKICGYSLLVHPKAKYYALQTEDSSLVLIGHAYNPFDGLYDENEILRKYADSEDKIGYFNQWTGVFTLIVVKADDIEVWGDCAGMQCTYYGTIEKHFYLSSHAQLIGDLCNLTQSAYVRKLTQYRFWQMYGLFLLGDISQFDDVFRLVPNHVLNVAVPKFSCKLTRFYPNCDISVVKNEWEYDETIVEIGRLLHKNMELIANKWDKPAISMTGGMDSKTTVACANGLYDKFDFYSYISMYGDRPDAEAAEKIAAAIGVTHHTYTISENDGDFEDVSAMRAVMEHNLGDIGAVNANDVRKRLFFLNTPDFDVEVKSWVSEIGRANYYKKFGLKKMPTQLSPRQMTSMYKFFTYNRTDANATDKIFRQYIEKTAFHSIYNLDSSDMYLWEFRYGGLGGLTITSEHRVSYDITIPYNNRLLIELFLRLPLEKRIEDIPHFDVIRKMNPAIDQLGITITNYNETKKRMYCERVYYLVNNALPF